MDVRSKAILEAAIKEYIKSGQPISSKELTEKYDFGLKWASIRRELGKLTKDGYLDQLHTSGGRVPTDKGYQFFIGNTLDNVATSRKVINDRYGGMANNLLSGELKSFVEDFSEETKSLGVGQKDRQVYKSGLDDLFEQIDLETKNELQEVVRDFELLDKRLEDLGSKILKSLEAPQVFVGKSPITSSRNLSVILDSYDIDGNKILIAIVGPKRMDYDKNLQLFKLLREYIEE
jgi:transcriptional regulator of heat shock response